MMHHLPVPALPIDTRTNTRTNVQVDKLATQL